MTLKMVVLKDGRQVLEQDYITAKTKDLILFGYEHLTEEGVQAQLEKIRTGKKLSVIGQFMVDDLADSERGTNEGA